MNIPTKLPVIAGVEITTDEAGRFNLNALHKADGGAESRAPSKWLRTQQTQDLVLEVENLTGQICVVTKEGRYGGTFVHELIAVAYAGWISPTFQIKVNQTFIDYRTGKLAPEPLSRASALSMSREARLQFKFCMEIGAMCGLEGNQLVIAANNGTRSALGADYMGTMGVTHITAPENYQDLNVSNIGSRVGGYTGAGMNKILCELGYQVQHRDQKDRPYYEPTEKGKRAGGVMKDTGKRHGSGTPIKQLMWSSRIIDELQQTIGGN